MVPYKPHQMRVSDRLVLGFAEPHRPKQDETPPAEALTIKAYWRVMVDGLLPEIVPDAPITQISLAGQCPLIEAGPLYIREVRPYLSGLPTDHVEIIAVSYRVEA